MLDKTPKNGSKVLTLLKFSFVSSFLFMSAVHGMNPKSEENTPGAAKSKPRKVLKSAKREQDESSSGSGGPLETLGELGTALPKRQKSKSKTARLRNVFSNSAKKKQAKRKKETEEYQLHQAANKQFFRKLTRNPKLRKAIRRFRNEIREGNNKFTVIPLDNISSRARILLFRELTTYLQGERLAVFFSFFGNDLSLDFSQKFNLAQPGNAGLYYAGTGARHREIFEAFDSLSTEEQVTIAEQLLTARRNHHKTPINRQVGIINLDKLNMLLDFEVARRFQGTEEEETGSEFIQSIGERKYQQYDHNSFLESVRNHPKRKKIDRNKDKLSQDAVPIASAIIGALLLSTCDQPMRYSTFFHAPKKETFGKWSFSYGDYSAFQGNPRAGHKEKATMNILNKWIRAGAAGNSTEEDIHQYYLNVFGGESESSSKSALGSPSGSCSEGLSSRSERALAGKKKRNLNRGKRSDFKKKAKKKRPSKNTEKQPTVKKKETGEGTTRNRESASLKPKAKVTKIKKSPTGKKVLDTKSKRKKLKKKNKSTSESASIEGPAIVKKKSRKGFTASDSEDSSSSDNIILES